MIEAIDGPSALRVLENKPAIDLLITDVGLPGGMNGRQVADAMVSILPELKVLFITGFGGKRGHRKRSAFAEHGAGH